MVTKVPTLDEKRERNSFVSIIKHYFKISVQVQSFTIGVHQTRQGIQWTPG